MSNPDDVTFWAACVLAFMLMLRKSNLVPDKVTDFDPEKQLACRHVKFVGSTAAWVDIVWSKTLQFRQKVLKYPLLRIHGSALCPVTALKRMVELVPGRPSGPLFVKTNGQPWMYSQFQQKLRVCLGMKKYKKKLFSSHSFRRGGCSFCFQAGIPDFLIKIIGDWKSDIYLSYCQVSLITRAKACQSFRHEINKLNL